MRRVLVLTSDTGAGHRSVSNALKAAAAEDPVRGIEVVDLDPFVRPPSGDAAGSLANRLVRLYGPVIVRAPWLWGAGFHLTDNALSLRAFLAIFGPTIEQRLATALEQTGASAIVSVHPLVNHAITRVRRRRARPLPLMTVVTDLVNVHRWWVAPGVDQYTVGSHIAAERLMACGVPPQRVAIVGIPLRRQFVRANITQREMRLRLGLDPDLTTLLVMGGGEGAGGLPDTVGAIAARAPSSRRFQMVVVTGRNARARLKLEAHSWPVPVRVLGLINNVAEFMIAADVIATKPGSLTVSEALAVGRPLLLGKPLPGQEEGNVGYVVRAGAGLHFRSPQEAADAFAHLLDQPGIRWEMGQRAAQLGRPQATERTLDLLQALLLRAESDRWTR